MRQSHILIAYSVIAKYIISNGNSKKMVFCVDHMKSIVNLIDGVASYAFLGNIQEMVLR